MDHPSAGQSQMHESSVASLRKRAIFRHKLGIQRTSRTGISRWKADFERKISFFPGDQELAGVRYLVCSRRRGRVYGGHIFPERPKSGLLRRQSRGIFGNARGGRLWRGRAPQIGLARFECNDLSSTQFLNNLSSLVSA